MAINFPETPAQEKAFMANDGYVGSYYAVWSQHITDRDFLPAVNDMRAQLALAPLVRHKKSFLKPEPAITVRKSFSPPPIEILAAGIKLYGLTEAAKRLKARKGEVLSALNAAGLSVADCRGRISPKPTRKQMKSYNL